MPEDQTDPSANTQAFQAWVNQTQPEEPARSKAPLVVGLVVALVVVVALVAVVLAVG